MTATKGTFISYRRSKGSMWALALHQRLTMQPDSVDVFYDIEELKAGPRQRHRGPLAESARRGRTGELCAVHHIFIDVIAAPDTKVQLPCLVNLPQAAAEQAVPSGLKVTRTYNELKPGDPKVGRVLSQSPTCNAVVDRGSTLSITVGSAGTTTSATPGSTTTNGSGGRSS